MKIKLGQIVLIGFFSFIGVLSANAQEHMNSFEIVGNTLENGQSLRPGQGIRSAENKYAAVLQKDGNFCLYQIVPTAKWGNKFVKCTMTVGSEAKKGAVLTMQEDGNLALYNSKGEHLWSTDTYRGGDDKQGGRLAMYDDGNLVLLSRSEKAIWNFQKGRLY